MNKEHAWRYSFLGVAVAVLPILIVFRMIQIQTNPEQVKAFRIQGEIYSGEVQTIKPARGQILDRWGHLLAGNKTVYEVGAQLNQVRNPDTIAMTLNVVLGLDYKTVFASASQKASPEAIYAVLANYVSQEKVTQLQGLAQKMEESYGRNRGPDVPSLRGLTFTPRLARSYPEKSLASNVLGFVSQEGRGYFGVEEKFNNLLAGKAKTVWVPLDPNRVEEMPSVPDGADLILTLDRAIQASTEAVLDRALRDSGAKSGSIVVLDPASGEILAMATTPRMDLNDFSRYLDLYDNENPYNPGVSEAFEPGSVFKVLTMAAGLDSGAVKQETSFIDTGVFEIGGTYIYNWNGGAWGPQDMQGCMEHSLNVCLAWVASQIGAKDFYTYMKAFGIGHQTGVDMAGEAPGRLKEPGDGDWYDADLGTNAFGQGVAVTPIQMASAAAAIANQGKMMAPHVVRSMVNKGYQYDMDKTVLGTPISAKTANELSEMLARSLENESSDALVTGYRLSGKTGTAEIPTPFGYTSNQTNASFIGWGPVDAPKFLVYVWLEKPQSSIWGSVVAAPVFRDEVEQLVVLMNIPPDDVRHKLLGQ